MRFRCWTVSFLAGWWLVGLPCAVDAAAAVGSRGMVSTVRVEASEAGVRAMRDGGNAVDAAVAAALTLGVVDGYNSGIGGGCFMLIHLASGEVVAIDGRETAPARASRDMYVRGGEVDPSLSQTGALAAGVPGALAAYEMAIAGYGKLSLSRHLRAAAVVAEEGFVADRTYVGRLLSVSNELRRFPEARSIFFHENGASLKPGEVLKQPDLARTYRAVAAAGIGWFYGGPFAEATETWMNAHGGVMTTEDFRKYAAKRREPVRSRYRGYEIVGFPPPSSGGVHVAQILNMLERFNLRSMGAGSSEFIHVTAEAMKRAFADRAHWLGDPDFARVPRGLISREYAGDLAAGIDPGRVKPVSGHGIPPDTGTDWFGKHTTHFSTADAEGNWVACTATINTTFGSKVVVPGTGVVLNNEMDDFSAQPGVANFFGLVGAEANAIQPGKRPLSSMSPTIVLKEGEPVLSVGAAGGPTIITQTLLAIVYRLDFGLDLETALRGARFHHQWRPDVLRVEAAVGAEVLEELRRKGHRIEKVRVLGATQAIGRDAQGRFVGVADPRGAGEAVGF